MKIDKAIELLEIAQGGFLAGDETRDFYTALDLGIEALKCVRKIRHHPFPDEVLLLPGEDGK